MLMPEEEVPDFECNTTKGKMSFHQYIAGSWCVLFSHTLAFTPICTTDLSKVAQLNQEFTRRGVKTIALTCSSVDDNRIWSEDMKQMAGLGASDEFPYPIISDDTREIAIKLGMLRRENKNKNLPTTVRAVIKILNP